MATPEMKELHRSLVTANHILHYHDVLDAYGHVSVRHPTKHDVYIMAKECPPALIESSDDLVEYWILDSRPVDENAAPGYPERYIDGEIYKRYPDVKAVIHSHDQTVMPYTTSGVPLIPVCHTAGFLGQRTPVFDIAPLYEAHDPQDLLVSSCRFGGALAEEFSGRSGGRPDHTVVLMRRHGFTAIGESLQSAVYRAVYTAKNAAVQMSSILLRDAFASRPRKVGFMHDPNPLTAEQVVASRESNENSQGKAWKLWCAEVERGPASSLYRNKV